MFVRPASGPDISLYPDPPGLGSVAGAAAHALPLVLNALADETGNDAKGKAGAVVRVVGDAMALRTGAPATFHDAELQAWAADPAGRLAARLPALAVAALGELRDAIGPILPAGVTVTVVGTELQVSFNSVTVGLATNPFAVRLVAAPEDIPGIDRAAIEVRGDSTGITLLDVSVGPTTIDAGDATLRPYARFRVGSNPPGGRRVEFGLGLVDDGSEAAGGALGARRLPHAGGHRRGDRAHRSRVRGARGARRGRRPGRRSGGRHRRGRQILQRPCGEARRSVTWSTRCSSTSRPPPGSRCRDCSTPTSCSVDSRPWP